MKLIVLKVNRFMNHRMLDL